MRTKEIGLMNGKCMGYGGGGSDEFNAGYELRQIQEKEKGSIVLTEKERAKIVYLLTREVEEMREGWQLAGIGEADFLEGLKNKIEEEV